MPTPNWRNLLSAILARTLPGETDGFGKDAQAQAVDFMLATAARRKSGTPNIAVDTFSDEGGRLAMRVAIINDDMPFLVDSVAAALASANVVIERLIHPVVDAERDASGTLSSLSDNAVRPESARASSMSKPRASMRRNGARWQTVLPLLKMSAVR